MLNRIKTFRQYNISEGIRDKMTPKSDDDIIKTINELDIDDKIEGLYGPTLRNGIFSNDLDSVDMIMKYMYNDYKNNIKDEHIKKAIEGCYSLALDKAIENGNIEIVEIVLYTPINGVKMEHLDNASNEIEKLIGGEDRTKWEIRVNREIAKLVYSDPRIQKLLNRRDRQYYDVAINEGVRDKMTPKSDEEVKKGLDKLSPDKKILKVLQYGVKDLYSKEEFQQMFIDVILDKYTEQSVFFVKKIDEKPRITLDVGLDIFEKMMKFGNGIYLHIMNPHYYTDIKEFFWEKNIAFSQVTATEYKILSHDKIKLVVSKLVDDIFNGENDYFIIRKFTNMMR